MRGSLWISIAVRGFGERDGHEARLQDEAHVRYGGERSGVE